MVSYFIFGFATPEHRIAIMVGWWIIIKVDPLISPDTHPSLRPKVWRRGQGSQLYVISALNVLYGGFRLG